ncbi:helix-turn-helix domain-containing protein [Grimontia hollisae]|uniref:DNA-binding transcriptional repressor PuuR n=1 Tax=Grimontia hollisae TaxID=673 RepID=A0A377J912_GRIHO|nr:helix-turn-helix transcriptional regulator [Grimontia hollisae]STO98956.1 DNA-binding transcriptional repressor PuuR [Grimontia hollisae]STR61833.1 DNA-binding transcriptional repressor PuuR [Grimontia hollisae]
MSSLRESVSRLLRSIRLECGLSQEKLARLSGIDRTFISGVERNQRNITLDTLDKLLEALDVNRAQFLIRLADMETR